jgi:deoxyribodipyrimidine photolyase-like uncharacterized protein
VRGLGAADARVPAGQGRVRGVGGRARAVVMEDFYGEQRHRFEILLTPGGAPAGAQWNLDRDTASRRRARRPRRAPAVEWLNIRLADLENLRRPAPPTPADPHATRRPCGRR